ncbi:MAG: DNA mismatch repair endonuclease MutL, partial [Alphaproteobacteria bacterium]
MGIRLLPPNLINQIAAGEVIERPSSALKELIENAIDAGSTRIDIVLGDGGKSYLSVVDNGKGMNKDDLAVCVERHATSKLPTNDLFAISSFGFRGEALPSIGSVARLVITSRQKGSDEAWQIEVEGGRKSNVMPASFNEGTKVEVKDLFFATPARLKFLKATPTETGYIKEVINHLAMANPEVSFRLTDEKRELLFYPATDNLLDRIGKIFGSGFAQNCVEVDAEHNGYALKGFASLPTYTRSTTCEQHLFVNGRWIKDRILMGCIKGAYQGLLGVDSGHPVVALFLTVPHSDVDVNVHPAKTEVRFKDAAIIRGLIVGSLKNALAEAGHKTSTTIGIGALDSTRTGILPPVRSNSYQKNTAQYYPKATGAFTSPEEKENNYLSQKPLQMDNFYSFKQTSVAPVLNDDKGEDFPPLGLARAQVMETYIISQTKDSIVITDQHAAHERLTYEKIRSEMDSHVQTQLLLIPEIVKLSEEDVMLLSSKLEELKKYGLYLEIFGGDSVMVREIPSVLGNTDIAGLVQDMADTFKEFGDTTALEDKIQAICAR